jgi:hypothetical protein
MMDHLEPRISRTHLSRILTHRKWKPKLSEAADVYAADRIIAARARSGGSPWVTHKR